MSIGVATSDSSENENVHGLYQQADDDMYKNKQIYLSSPSNKTIDMLLTVLSEKDFIKQGHTERLSKMAEMLSESMNLPDIVRKNLILLSKVHDLGKVSISDKILLKHDPLTDEEREKIKEHSQTGYNKASRSKELYHIADLILHHHEFWDGKGYPAGMKGAQIPFECRLLSIMDAYDAMTNMRPYRKGVSKKEALEEIKNNAGIQFDPELADKFIGCMNSVIEEKASVS